MQSDGLNPILGFMRHITAVGDASRLTDGQLLERFVTRRDEAAFYCTMGARPELRFFRTE